MPWNRISYFLIMSTTVTLNTTSLPANSGTYWVGNVMLTSRCSPFWTPINCSSNPGTNRPLPSVNGNPFAVPPANCSPFKAMQAYSKALRSFIQLYACSRSYRRSARPHSRRTPPASPRRIIPWPSLIFSCLFPFEFLKVNYSDKRNGIRIRAWWRLRPLSDGQRTVSDA